MKRVSNLRITLIIIILLTIFVACKKQETPQVPGHDGIYNGYEFVDLGLPSGVKWATCNLGAEVPEASGDYFAWGEVESKGYFGYDNCVSYGIPLDDISGDERYDAARAIWGGTWRIPTLAEFQELLAYATWSWVVQPDRTGYQITGPNGKSFFLPAAGFCFCSTIYNAEIGGYYWSSTAYEKYTDRYYNLVFHVDEQVVRWRHCSNGRCIRAVSE